jgi:ribonucleases P/MRP protein subunit RPP40
MLIKGMYPIDVIYLDFQKAFDTVPHIRLVLKLRALGIADEIYNWIEDWLNDRMQRVIVLGANSDRITVKSGVPQGSVLGPLLFFDLHKRYR